MRGIWKHFGATSALQDVNLSVLPAEVLALVGENGAGKSTLMKILSGALTPDRGTMFLNGQPFNPRNPHDARMAGVGMVYQELSVAPHLTVAENIMLGMEPARFGILRRGAMEEASTRALSLLGHSEIDPNERTGNLSLAEQQLVEIARTVASGCRILVLDEPTSSLSAADISRLFELLRTLKNQGQAVIYISHFLEEVKRVADRFVVLRDGRAVETGKVSAVPTGRLIRLMIGREVKDLYPRSRRIPGDVVLHVEKLAGSPKPQDASLILRRGEVFGIAGLMGAGRSELLRTIFGLAPIRSGKVKFGAYVGPASPTRRWMQGMGMVSEDRKREGLALSLSVSDNITLSRLTGFGPWGTVVQRRQDRSAAEWIRKLRIRCSGPRQSVTDLSGGNQQKVALARLLHHDVDVFLLDEPTRGIDVGSKAEIYGLINDLALRGKSILLVSSYLPELLGICDRVAVMTRGRLHAPHPAKKLTEHQAMMEATGTA